METLTVEQLVVHIQIYFRTKIIFYLYNLFSLSKKIELERED